MTGLPVLSGRYELRKKIGQGGMGCIWLALDRLLDRQVAIKEMYPQLRLTEAEQVTMYERVAREARYGALIDHPSLITVHDVVITDDKRPWIVMQYLELPTLHDYVHQKGALSVPEVIKIARNLLDALKAVHAKGIVHRDVKPSNILVREDGTIVLLDFGIAKRPQDTAITDIGMMIGSPPFMAPECFKRDATVGPAADLWAVGLVLYFALTGVSPFQRDTNEATWYAILQEDVPMGPIEGPLADLVSGLLDKDAAARLTLPQAQDLLKKAIRTTELRTATTARPTVLTVPARKRRRAVLAAAIVILSSATLIVPIAMNSGGEKHNSGSPAQASKRPGVSPTSTPTSASQSPASPSPSTSKNLRPYQVTERDGKRFYRDAHLSFVLPDKWEVLDTTNKNEVQLKAASDNIYSIEVLGTGNLKDAAEQRHTSNASSQDKGSITYGDANYAIWDFTAPASCSMFCPPGTRTPFSEEIRRTSSGTLIDVTVTQDTLLPKGNADDSTRRRSELHQFSSQISTM